MIDGAFATLGDFCPTSVVGTNTKVLDCQMNVPAPMLPMIKAIIAITVIESFKEHPKV
jgi:hypothetical protein